MATQELPRWAQSVANNNNAVGVKFLAVKTLEAIDVSKDLPRIRLPKKATDDILRPYLTDEEKEIVDLLDVEIGSHSSEDARRFNKGLDVFVFVLGLRLELQLTSWDGFVSDTNIKGSDWLKYSWNLEEGDDYAIWMFRLSDKDNHEKLCFIFHKLV